MEGSKKKTSKQEKKETKITVEKNADEIEKILAVDETAGKEKVEGKVEGKAVRKITKKKNSDADHQEESKTTSKKKTSKKAGSKKTEIDQQPTEEKQVASKKKTAKKIAEAKAEEKDKVEEVAVKAEEKAKIEEAAAKTEEKDKVEDTAAKKEEKAEKKVTKKASKAKTEEKAAKKESKVNPEENVVEKQEVEVVEEVKEPRRSILFVGSECFPFVKTGGLADVMYALTKALLKQNCDVRVILPKYACIPWEYQEKMEYIHNFYMDLRRDGKNYYVGVFKYEMDGVTYYFIDNEELFSEGNPYTSIPNDVVKFTYFCKAALAVLPIVDFIPDIIHCHDWQASLVPIYLRTLFSNTETCRRAQTIMTIHNLKFQGVCNLDTLRFWSGLPDDVFTDGVLKDGIDANMLKGGLTYANKISTVSNTYAGEIKTATYGEHLDQHIGYHHMKLCGIVNGIDYDMYNPKTDSYIYENYSIKDVIEKKKKNKRALQEELGLEQDTGKFVVGIISRLTDQKGLDLINFIMNALVDPYTQVAVLGTGDSRYEESFRYYENHFKGRVCSNIMYSEERAHKIYAGADALLVPSQFEPCGLTQLIAMHYGTVPIVRETGGLKDTVQAYNEYEETGNGFSFYEYNANQLLNIVNYAKTVYFTRRESWDAMVKRDMEQDVSWTKSATQYKALYDSMLGW